MQARLRTALPAAAFEAGSGRRRASKDAWTAAALVAWGAALLLLAVIFVRYLSYAADIVRYPFGLNYSEGLIWQQALWLGGPHMYGDIGRFPFLVFEYPPVYHLLVRALAALGPDMLLAGRLVSFVSTLVAAALMASLAARLAEGTGRLPQATAALLAGLLPFTLLPVISWSPLLRVDMLGLAFTAGGLRLAVAALRRRRLLIPSILLFVLACYTKQTFVAAPVAVLILWLLRDPRAAIRAGACGLVAGLVALGLLSWLTHGGFLRHILGYNINRFSLAVAVGQAGKWLLAYGVFAALAGLAVALRLRGLVRRVGQGGVLAAMREDEAPWLSALLCLYLLFSTVTLAFAGKSGASINYFIEWLCLWCVLIGWLAAAFLAGRARSGPLSVCLPLALVLQMLPVPGSLAFLHAAQISPARTRAAQALLDRVRAIPGPLLSDDMVLVRQAGREVGLEPAILAELSANGQWPEQALVGLLQRRFFGAVITAYGPGDPTFEARYLPRTREALLAAYPHVETYGDYRLRLP
jgi:hypothetical protein